MNECSTVPKEVMDLLAGLRDGKKDRKIRSIIMNDNLIIEFARREISKSNKGSESHPQIRQRLRELARLLEVLRNVTGNENRPFSSFLRPSDWSLILEKIRELCFSDDKSFNDKNTLSSMLGFSVKKIAQSYLTICETSNVTLQNEKAKEVKVLLDIYNRDYSVEIRSRALKNKNDAHAEKPLKMPNNSDIMKFYQGLRSEIMNLFEKMSEKYDNELYRPLLKAVLVYLVSYNRRRAGEFARTKLTDFFKAKNNFYGKHEELLANLDQIERSMSDYHMILKLIGKRGRHVSALVPKWIQPILDFLVSKRALANVPDENPYLFPTMSTNNYIKPYADFCRYSEKFDLEDPESIRSTKLRKAFATSLQVLNLEKFELEKVANFLVSLNFIQLFFVEFFYV